MALAPSLSLPVALTWDGCRADPSEHVAVHLDVAPDGLVLRVDAPLHDDPPPADPPGPTWELWQHEVVEFFLLGADQRYLEVELGPHGHHLVLQLSGPRQVRARCLPLDVALDHSQPGRWGATARIPAYLLPEGPHRANAYAIHGVGAQRRYLAWTPVPGPAPDFHRLACFPPVDLPGSRIASKPD